MPPPPIAAHADAPARQRLLTARPAVEANPDPGKFTAPHEWATRLGGIAPLAGRATPATLRVTEPEPGRLLRETYDESGGVTDFVIDPVPGGCRVRIDSTLPAAPGPRGFIERFLTPRLLLPAYRDELSRLDRAATAG